MGALYKEEPTGDPVSIAQLSLTTYLLYLPYPIHPSLLHDLLSIRIFVILLFSLFIFIFILLPARAPPSSKSPFLTVCARA